MWELYKTNRFMKYNINLWPTFLIMCQLKWKKYFFSIENKLHRNMFFVSVLYLFSSSFDKWILETFYITLCLKTLYVLQIICHSWNLILLFQQWYHKSNDKLEKFGVIRDTWSYFLWKFSLKLEQCFWSATNLRMPKS